MRNILSQNNQEENGVVIGTINGKTLYDNSNDHLICIGPERSAKTVSFSIPTLLSWKDSCLVYDKNDYLWDLTSKWRSSEAGHKCIHFNPSSKWINDKSKGSNLSKWNPLDEISDADEINDVHIICSLIVNPNGYEIKEQLMKNVLSLLIGTVIHLKHNVPNNCNLQTLDLMLTGQINFEEVRKNKGRLALFEDKNTHGLYDLWVDMNKGIDCNNQPYKANEAAINAANDMYERTVEDANLVLTKARELIAIYQDPIVAANTSTSDFKIKDLLTPNTTIYIGGNSSEWREMIPILKLFTKLAINAVLKSSIEKKILFLVDDFWPVFNYRLIKDLIDSKENKIKLFLELQAYKQLIYINGITLLDAVNVKVLWMPPYTMETTEIMTNTINKGLDSEQHLTIEECISLPRFQQKGEKPGVVIVTQTGYKPIWCKQDLYFKNKLFMKRVSLS